MNRVHFQIQSIDRSLEHLLHLHVIERRDATCVVFLFFGLSQDQLILEGVVTVYRCYPLRMKVARFRAHRRFTFLFDEGLGRTPAILVYPHELF